MGLIKNLKKSAKLARGAKLIRKLVARYDSGEFEFEPGERDYLMGLLDELGYPPALVDMLSEIYRGLQAVEQLYRERAPIREATKVLIQHAPNLALFVRAYPDELNALLESVIAFAKSHVSEHEVNWMRTIFAAMQAYAEQNPGKLKAYAIQHKAKNPTLARV